MSQPKFFTWNRTLLNLAESLTRTLSELNALELKNPNWRKFAGQPYHNVESARYALILEICLNQSNFAEDVCNAIIYSDLTVESALNRTYRQDREDAYILHENLEDEKAYKNMTPEEYTAWSEAQQEKYADRG